MRKKILEGSVKRHPDGFGFFIPDNKEEPDVYIPRQYMNGVMANDRVKVSVTAEPGGNRFRGEVLGILTRSQTKVVGVFTPLNTKFGIIRDDGHSWGSDLRIPVAASKGAKKGQLISADVTSYPEEEEGFQGSVSEILGDAEDPLTDVKRVLISNSIPHEWPKGVLNEAKGLSEFVEEKDMQGRKDIRDLKFVTIDGKTAKDFDDAILVDNTDRGFRLYVAIADVSHYVRPGSAIDGEAYTRGTSVYFPNFVVPMLPEVLSNGLCSLNPHLPRLALVAEIEMDFQGQVLETDFYEAVIESKARVTYGEAQELMDGGDVGGKLNHVRAEILRAQDLAKILMAKRFREGALDLEIPETQIV